MIIMPVARLARARVRLIKGQFRNDCARRFLQKSSFGSTIKTRYTKVEYLVSLPNRLYVQETLIIIAGELAIGQYFPWADTNDNFSRKPRARLLVSWALVITFWWTVHPVNRSEESFIFESHPVENIEYMRLSWGIDHLMHWPRFYKWGPIDRTATEKENNNNKTETRSFGICIPLAVNFPNSSPSSANKRGVKKRNNLR